MAAWKKTGSAAAPSTTLQIPVADTEAAAEVEKKVDDDAQSTSSKAEYNEFLSVVSAKE